MTTLKIFERCPNLIKILTLKHHQYASKAELAIYPKNVWLLIQVKSKQSVNIIVSDGAHFYIEKVVWSEDFWFFEPNLF